MPSEYAGAQYHLLILFPTPEQRKQNRFFGVDRPEEWDTEWFAVNFPSSCIVADALHMAIRVEACSGEAQTPLSKVLRKILFSFKLAKSDGKAVYSRLSSTIPDISLLPKVAAITTPARAACEIQKIRRIEYLQEAQTSDRFVRGLAALVVAYPDEQRRKNSKGRTLRSVLNRIASQRNVEYLLNGPRVLSQLPRETQQLAEEKWYVTASCEANAMALKNHYANCRQILDETAYVKTRAFSLPRLLVAFANFKADPSIAKLAFREKLRRLMTGFSNIFSPHAPIDTHVMKPRPAPDVISKSWRVPRKSMLE